MAHRESIKNWLRSLPKIESGRVVDWGCGTKPVNHYIMFGEDVKYFGIDMLPHVGADLVADITQPIYLGVEYDYAFCMEVLEHAEYPSLVVQNIWRNLKPGGTLYGSVPFMYPHHSDRDYWRYTDQGIALLLSREGFTNIVITPTENNMGWLFQAVKNAR